MSSLGICWTKIHRTAWLDQIRQDEFAVVVVIPLPLPEVQRDHIESNDPLAAATICTEALPNANAAGDVSLSTATVTLAATDANIAVM